MFFLRSSESKKHAEFEGEAQVFKSNLVRNGFPPQNLIVFQCFFLKAGLPMTISLDHVIGDFTTSAFLVHTFA
jgi:hypothetical protein